MGYQNTVGATSDLIGNKIADGITEFSKNSQKNNSETIKNENYKKTPHERYVSPEKEKEIIDNHRLI